MHAYEMIGLNYYYQGDLKRAKKYTKKVMRGEFESEASYTKILINREFQSKNEEKDFLFGVPNI